MKVLVALSLGLTTSLLAQTPGPGISSGKHPFTFEDMMKLKRVGAPGGHRRMENGWCSIAKMSIWKRTRKFRIYGSCRRKTANRGGSTQLPTMRNAHVFLPMANDSSGHRKRPIRRKSGCAILTQARARSSVSRIRSRYFDWCGRRDLVAGREEYRVRVGGVSGLQG